MTANETDIELCELYLDHELADADVRQFDDRLAADASLRATLDRLRGQRTTRLEAMSTAFDTDAASVERLVASVRTAQASEALRRKRAWWVPNRAAMAAAAAIAFGVTLGGVIQGRQGGHWLATPGETPTANASARIVNGNTVGLGGADLGGLSLGGHGAYFVSLLDANGRERVKVRFQSAEHARQFIESVNNGGAGSLRVRDARVLDESY